MIEIFEGRILTKTALHSQSLHGIEVNSWIYENIPVWKFYNQQLFTEMTNVVWSLYLIHKS